VTRSAPCPVRLLSALILVFGLPTHAFAHATVKGMSDFINGGIHPLLTPAHMLILLGLGLSLGQHVPFKPALALLVFAPCSALALALTARFTTVVPQPVLILIALCAGAVVALGKQLPAFARGALFAAGALAIGLDSGVETDGGAAMNKTLVGTWVSLVVCTFTIAWYASLAAAQNRKWIHIALRVVGSWIVAISLLMLAFALRKQPSVGAARELRSFGNVTARQRAETRAAFRLIRPGSWAEALDYFCPCRAAQNAKGATAVPGAPFA
jgi:urease accessory protein